MLKDFIQYRNLILKISAAAAGILALALLQTGRTDVVYGFALGAGWSMAKLWLRARQLQRLGMHQDKGRNIRYSFAGNITLYAATGAVLAAAFAVEAINQWAAVAGVFLTNIVMIAYEVFRNGIAGRHIRQGVHRDGD